MSEAHSALVVLVPEAEDLVAPFRARHDPSAAVGVPAHVTLIYPFRPPARIDDATRQTLAQALAPIAPFRFRLGRPARLGDDVLHLPPDPAEPFRRIALALWHRFPDTPPYGGQHLDIVPHLTVAQIADRLLLDTVVREFAAAAKDRLPIEAEARAVALMDDADGGRWAVRQMLPLGG